MPQKLQLNTQMPLSVLDFIQLGGANKQAAITALEQTGVTQLASQSVHDVSGGEMQRILLARALLRKPNLLVLDEPAQGVDLSGQAALYELIGELRDELHCAVLMVSHDLHLVMANTDKVICLNKHVCCHGSPDHVSSDPAFIDLFGDRYAKTLAVYHHHHDHDHDIHGDVIKDEHH
jgi:zinc transport system ATP-binding protein